MAVVGKETVKKEREPTSCSWTIPVLLGKTLTTTNNNSTCDDFQSQFLSLLGQSTISTQTKQFSSELKVFSSSDLTWEKEVS
jgi:hypothetical protein